MKISKLDKRISATILSIFALAFAAVIYSRTMYHPAPGMSEAYQYEQECAAAKQANGGKTTKECKDLLTLTFEDPVALYTLVLTISTILSFVATAGLVFAAVRQRDDTLEAIEIARTSADAATRSARIAEKTLIASNRAWLKVEVGLGDQPLMENDGAVTFAFSVRAINVGKEPAINVQSHIWMLIWRTDFEHNPYRIQAEKCEEARSQATWAGHTVFPGDVYEGATGYGPANYVIGLDAESIKAAGNTAHDNEGNPILPLFVGGCVSYSFPADPEKRHITQFMFQLTRRMQPIRLKDCPISAFEFELTPMYGGMPSPLD
ncbi:hypothetical protein [Methylobacterium sp. yr668]|uniref:hypothetical protein n=1 Tax=Methylobacterium sp. yr668 TaxID=1761801 RepID=UPI0008F458E7|nr:hypothetical protein [Methylobacterium sp. yr668]SFS58468.1 hypothetical protein SAMN04487845_10420 [Methylobacterium sp. yr668]